MRADNSRHVVAAARRRSEATRARALAALRRMDAAGIPVTFDAVAEEARVSRSWLYGQPDLRAEVERLRERQQPAAGRAVPDRQRASDASLRRRLEVATARIRDLEADNKQLRAALARDLEADNKQLRAALARALGERRVADRLGETGDRDGLGTRAAAPSAPAEHGASRYPRLGSRAP